MHFCMAVFNSGDDLSKHMQKKVISMHTANDLREAYHNFKAVHPNRGARLPAKIKQMAASLIRSGEETVQTLSQKIDVSPEAIQYWLLSKKQLCKKAKNRQKTRMIERRQVKQIQKPSHNIDSDAVRVNKNGMDMITMIIRFCG